MMIPLAKKMGKKGKLKFLFKFLIKIQDSIVSEVGTILQQGDKRFEVVTATCPMPPKPSLSVHREE